MTASRRSPLDVAVPLVVSGVQLVSAYVVLGRPDLGAARDFLTGTAPSMAGSVAAAQVVLWAALVVAVAGAAVTALTRTVGAVPPTGRRALWPASVLAIGLLILAAGAGHRSAAASVSLSGGSLPEARAQLPP